MRCPKCGSLDDKVTDSRLAKEGASIRRRRECLSCGARFTTFEEMERIDLRVTKRDGRIEPLDRQKILVSIAKACEKRPISYDEMERTVSNILHDLDAFHDREVPSRLIGAKVMEKLRDIDPVAYVRYASVYRQFQEIGDFIEEIESFEKCVGHSPAQTELFKP